MICPVLKNSRPSWGLRANLIPCASGELNKAAGAWGRRGSGSWRGLKFGGGSRWTTTNQTAAVINSAGGSTMSLSERPVGAGSSSQEQGRR